MKIFKFFIISLFLFSCEQENIETQTSEEVKLKSVVTSERNRAGETKVIPSITPVPSGWVIVDSVPGRNNTIMYVVGSPTGTKIKIKNYSTFPPGWVIINSVPGRNNTIQNAIGYRKGTSLIVVSHSPIPSGWVVVKSIPGRTNTIRFNG